MAGTSKVGGGINPMHLSDTKHPFEISTKKGSFTGRSKFAKTTGVGPQPGGEGDQISANSARGPVRGGINGPGVAK